MTFLRRFMNFGKRGEGGYQKNAVITSFVSSLKFLILFGQIGYVNGNFESKVLLMFAI